MVTDETARWQNDANLTGSARIDLACDDFEAAWRENRSPSIEAYLLQLPADNRETIFRELLTVELTYRQRAGEKPETQDYLVRFPDYETEIVKLFKELIRPQQLGDYELLDKLGKGGMGVVYKARHKMLDRIVAVKVLPENYTEDDQTLSRFQREMKLIARLDHRNIVRAHDAREENGIHYLVMEYVDGVNLHELVGHLGPLPIAAACEIIRQVALGLEHANEHGLVHRDMKPSNMMLSRSGEVKLLDLGLARLSAEHQHTRQLTEAGFAMGTVDYMAPEQWEDSSGVDIRADIYSLGCTLFYILTGSAPYTGPQYSSARKKLMAHAAAPIPSARARRTEIPPELDEVLECIMSKEPEDRPQAPFEVAEALEAWADPHILADMLHEAFEGEGGVYTTQLRSSTPDDMTPRGRSSGRGGTPTRKSSRWMRTTHRRKQEELPWYRQPRVVLPLSALLLGVLGWVVIALFLPNGGSLGGLKPEQKERLIRDVVVAPGPYGDWWLEEVPWLMPSVRARLLERIEAGENILGGEKLSLLESLSRGSDVDTYEESLQRIVLALLEEARDSTPTDEKAEFLLSEKASDLPADDFRGHLEQLLAELSKVKSPTAVQLHERAILLHATNQWLIADEVYQQALDAYAKEDAPLNSLGVLCQADRAMLAFHRSEYLSAVKQFRELRHNQLGAALDMHARAYEIDSFRKLLKHSDAEAAFLAAQESHQATQEFELGNFHPLRAYLLERNAWNELDRGHFSAALVAFREANQIRMPGGEGNPLNDGNWGAYAFNKQGVAMSMHFLGDDRTSEEFRTLLELLENHSDPRKEGAVLGWEERLRLRERFPNTYERQADEFIYGSSADRTLPNYRAAQSALELMLQRGEELYFDLHPRKWPHMNRVRYKLALVLALQIGEENADFAAAAQRQITEAERIEAEKAGSEPLPEAVTTYFVSDRRLARAVLGLRSSEQAEQLAARAELLAMVREAEAEDINRSNIEPLLMAIEQLAQTSDLADDWAAERAELAARLTAITAELRHSPADADQIQQQFLRRYSQAVEPPEEEEAEVPPIEEVSPQESSAHAIGLGGEQQALSQPPALVACVNRMSRAHYPVQQQSGGARVAITLVLWLASLTSAVACTRVLWNSNERAVVVGRTMDWPKSTEPLLEVYPRGIERDGGQLGPATVVAENPARWVSKYGSITATAYGLAAVDGLNERGLAVHLLYLTATDFGERDTSKQGLHAGLWGQYLLDNAASVAEALELMQSLQPVMVSVDGMAATVHLAMEDATGDSAIIEYIAGKPVVHHGSEYRVMTNDPAYNEQLANLAKYDFTNATRQTPLPGNVDPQHRFVRASYFLQMLPKPESERAALASILAIARNVSVPFGAPNRQPGTLYNTEYRTAIDITNQRYFFELTTAPNVIWLELGKFNLAAGRPVLTLNPDDIALSGDVSARFA